MPVAVAAEALDELTSSKDLVETHPTPPAAPTMAAAAAAATVGAPRGKSLGCLVALGRRLFADVVAGQGSPQKLESRLRRCPNLVACIAMPRVFFT